MMLIQKVRNDFQWPFSALMNQTNRFHHWIILSECLDWVKMVSKVNSVKPSSDNIQLKRHWAFCSTDFAGVSESKSLHIEVRKPFEQWRVYQCHSEFVCKAALLYRIWFGIRFPLKLFPKRIPNINTTQMPSEMPIPRIIKTPTWIIEIGWKAEINR